jgi:hypothetical protein
MPDHDVSGLFAGDVNLTFQRSRLLSPPPDARASRLSSDGKWRDAGSSHVPLRSGGLWRLNLAWNFSLRACNKTFET